ncbi:MAG: phycobilisome linker polypeptide [Cyanobacteria bacterium P01_G01_bin.19]
MAFGSFGPASQLGVAIYEDTPALEYVPGCSAEELETIIRAIYKQVLGNAYVMESERASIPESQFKQGNLSVREFVRAIGKSDLYRSRFFDTCPRYRYTELNFKHFLGRAPNDYDDMKAHSAILDEGGFEADIDSYLDSDEYQNAYGEYFVPYPRGYKSLPGQTMVQFTHMFALLPGAAGSDLKGSLAGKTPALNKDVILESPISVVAPSGGTAGDGWSFQEPPLSARTRQGSGAGENGKVYRIEVTGYGARAVNRVSKFRRSNKVYLVPYDKLSQEYQRIHKQGGKIASITPVN